MDVDALAQRIWQARRNGLILPAPSTTGTPLDLATAYRVQQAVTARRRAAGEQIVGWKLGYTSQVMREQMGIGEPKLRSADGCDGAGVGCRRARVPAAAAG